MTADTASSHNLAGLLDEALAPFQDRPPGLVADLKSGAGLDPDLPVDGQITVVAYHLDPGEELFVAHLVTPTRFIRHERSVGDDTLTVAIPLRRITRVSALQQGGATVVKVEYDADATVAETSGEMFTAPIDNHEIAGAAGSRTLSQTRTSRAYYELAGPNAALFASKLTGAL